MGTELSLHDESIKLERNTAREGVSGIAYGVFIKMIPFKMMQSNLMWNPWSSEEKLQASQVEGAQLSEKVQKWLDFVSKYKTIPKLQKVSSQQSTSLVNVVLQEEAKGMPNSSCNFTRCMLISLLYTCGFLGISAEGATPRMLLSKLNKIKLITHPDKMQKSYIDLEGVHKLFTPEALERYERHRNAVFLMIQENTQKVNHNLDTAFLPTELLSPIEVKQLICQGQVERDLFNSICDLSLSSAEQKSEDIYLHKDILDMTNKLKQHKVNLLEKEEKITILNKPVLASQAPEHTKALGENVIILQCTDPSSRSIWQSVNNASTNKPEQELHTQTLKQ